MAIIVTNNIPNTTETHTVSGRDVTLTVQADDGYLFDGVPSVEYDNYDGDFEIINLSVNGAGVLATGVCPNVDEEITIKGETVSTAVPEQVWVITNNLTLCQPIEPLPQYIKQGETLTITVQANEGTEFKADDNTPSVEYEYESGDFVKLPFTISEDKNTATITVIADSVNFSDGLTLTGGAVPKQVIGSNYGAINVYKVTLDELEQFAKVRFFKEVGSDGSTFENIDLGKWVNRIKRIYTDVPVSSTDVIKCGNYDTGVECHAPAVETITLDFGSVNIPAPNGDITDYNSEIRVFLPFAGFVSLPTDYVGLSITLTYIINTITGDGIAKLSHNDIVFQTAEVRACSDVIYKLAETVVGGEMWDGNELNGHEPYVYVKTFVSLNNTGRNSDSIRGKLSDFKGFNIFADVSPIGSAEMTVEEQQTIIRLLESGVYIE